MFVSYIVITLLALCFLALCGSFFVFDQLVMAEYFNHRHQWELDGKPTGYFWVPEGATLFGGRLVRFGSALAGSYRWRVWLWSTPAWIKGDRHALRLLYWWRALYVGPLVGIPVAVLVLFLR